MKGTVYWFTGLSGAGKSTIGRQFYEQAKTERTAIVWLDGDELRDVLGTNGGYSLDERKATAYRYARLCKLLSDQGVDVVCCTISMFEEVRAWNRANIDFYREIYIKVPLDVLVERDQKQLYSRALRGEVANVMGVDLPFEEPVSPDLVILNDGAQSVDQIVQLIRQSEAL